MGGISPSFAAGARFNSTVTSLSAVTGGLLPSSSSSVSRLSPTSSSSSGPRESVLPVSGGAPSGSRAVVAGVAGVVGFVGMVLLF